MCFSQMSGLDLVATGLLGPVKHLVGFFDQAV